MTATAVRTCSIEDCEKPSACRTWCWTHYDRWRRHGDPTKLGPRGERGTIVADPVERFWSKVEKTEGCWVWVGNTTGRRPGRVGYGSIVMGGRSVLAHRWSYEHHVGPIPEGWVIDHLCRETRCVNPDHLEAVTLQENSRRAGGTSLPARCGFGHDMADARSRKDGTRYCGTCANEAQRRRREKARVVRGSEAWLDANPDSDAAGVVAELLKVLR